MNGEYNNLPVTMALISISLILIFILIIVVFFAAFNQTPMHDILVVNNSGEKIYVRFGALSLNGTTSFLPDKQLDLKESWTYKATPGTIIQIQGYNAGDIAPIQSANPLTTVRLILAGEGFNGKSQISDGNNIADNLEISTESVDRYGISVQAGYNIPISIYSSGFNNRDPNNNFSCVGPQWNHTIDATGPNACPSALIYPGAILNPEDPVVYQSCSTPCTAIGGTAYCCTENDACTVAGGCETTWPVQDYYTVFQNACPNCLITNCDMLNYSCGSKNGLTQYTITFGI